MRFAIVLFLMSIGNAYAGPCDTFDLISLDVRDLKRCISEMNTALYLKDAQIRLLESQMCLISLELREVRPDSVVLKDICPPSRRKSKK